MAEKTKTKPVEKETSTGGGMSSKQQMILGVVVLLVG